MPERPILNTEGVSLSFGGIRALRDVSLAVDEGSIHCLIGHNGAGKTTLFNVLAGTLRSDAGTIAFQGEPITGRAAHRISRLGLVRSFQRPRAVPTMTVGENIALAVAGRRARHRLARLIVMHAPVEDAVAGIVEAVRLPDPRTPVLQLSHGMRKRLELGIALGCEPRMLLLDEPTAGMNADETAGMVEVIKRVAGSVTVLLIEHDLAFVRRIADRVTVMHEGEILTEGTIDEVERHPVVREIYMGSAR